MVELPPVEVKENDVCIKMLASPINPSDINRIEGSSHLFLKNLNYNFLNFRQKLNLDQILGTKSEF